MFVGIGYLGIFAALGRAIVTSKDIFNPLCLILFIGVVRYCCPAFLRLLGIEPHEDVAVFYRLMGLSDSDWFWAHVLVLTSFAGISLGWFLVQERRSKLLCWTFLSGPVSIMRRYWPWLSAGRRLLCLSLRMLP